MSDGGLREAIALRLRSALTAWDEWGITGDDAPCDPEWDLDEFLGDEAAKAVREFLASPSSRAATDEPSEAIVSAAAHAVKHHLRKQGIDAVERPIARAALRAAFHELAADEIERLRASPLRAEPSEALLASILRKFLAPPGFKVLLVGENEMRLHGTVELSDDEVAAARAVMTDPPNTEDAT